MTADLVAFLRGRLDEDASDIATAHPMPGQGSRLATMQGTTVLMSATRALAEVDAKRRLLGLHTMDWRERPERGVGEADDPYCVACFGEGYPCETLRLLALPYASHPGYRPEWAPDT